MVFVTKRVKKQRNLGKTCFLKKNQQNSKNKKTKEKHRFLTDFVTQTFFFLVFFWGVF